MDIYVRSKNRHTFSGADYGLLPRFLLLAFFMCTGAISALVIENPNAAFAFWKDAGSSFTFGTEMTADTFIGTVCFQLLALLLSTSYLGLFCLPVLAFVFGWRLSFSAMLSFALLGGKPLSVILAVFVPLCFYLPCFFITATDALGSSGRLRGLMQGCACRERDRILVRFAACVPFLAAGAAFQRYLLPILVLLVQ